jgi:Hus1-like protein
LNDNHIGLRLQFAHLHKALMSANFSTDIALRLVKRNEQPHICFTISVLVCESENPSQNECE